MKISAKKGIQQLITACRQYGVKTVVISPGSRNAPLIVSFNQVPEISCLSVPDERVAAFFALGISLARKEPVALLCTSGSAALNFAPAIAEAYYQRAPLIVLTADRPVEWTDQGDGQTINQTDLYKNYIRKSFAIISEPVHKDEFWHNQLRIAEVFNQALVLNPGPVQFNIPLREPLYEFEDISPDVPAPRNRITTLKKSLGKETALKLAGKFCSAKKVMILVGQLPYVSAELNNIIADFARFENVVVLSETSSNIYADNIISTIDRLITPLQQLKKEGYMPELLISISGNIISKRIKAILRQSQAAEHWHIDEFDTGLDTFQSLTQSINLTPANALAELREEIAEASINSDYRNKWLALKNTGHQAHLNYLKDIPESDFKVFELINEALPANAVVHMGNSSPVRYMQLFGNKEGVLYQSNRGTSGIDGSTSTAAGFAYCTPERPNILLSGDVAFMYDSNAFWNKHIPKNLKVIVINNGGGGIFRIIPGPDSTNELEEFFETAHPGKISGIADTFGLAYTKCENTDELAGNLEELISSSRASILEIVTPKETNPQVLKDYFEYIKSTLN